MAGSQKNIAQVYSKLEEMELLLNNLLIKIKDTNTVVNDLVAKGSIATTELDAASAKIIFEICKTLSEKIDTCPCNKDILDAIKNIPRSSMQIEKPKIDFQYRSPPPVSDKSKYKPADFSKLANRYE